MTKEQKQNKLRGLFNEVEELRFKIIKSLNITDVIEYSYKITKLGFEIAKIQEITIKK